MRHWPQARVICNATDLPVSADGHGRHGFDFRFPAPLASDRPHMLVARRATDRAPLTGAATVAERRSPNPRCSLRSAHRATRNDGYGAL